MATDKTDKSAARALASDSRLAGGVQRRPYHPPVLTTYGHISKLTMASWGSGADGGARASKMRTACL